MAGWRDLNRKALRVVHEKFEVPAVYLTHIGGEPIPVKVRLHQKADQASGYSEFDMGMAGSIATIVDTIIFEASAVSGMVMNNAYVIFGEEEAYFTGASHPERRGYIRVEVSRVTQKDLNLVLDSFDLDAPEWVSIFPEDA